MESQAINAGTSNTNYVSQQLTERQSQAKQQNDADTDGQIAKDAAVIATEQDLPDTVGEKALIKSIEAANKKLLGKNKEFEFSVHEGTKQIMVKVVDKDSGKVIREIPPEKILDMVASMCEAAGLFVDKKC